MKVTSGLKELEIPAHRFLRAIVHLEKRAPRDVFFRNHKPNHVPEISLSYLQNMPIYYHPGKHEISIRSFLEYSAQSFSCTIFLALQNKRMFGA